MKVVITGANGLVGKAVTSVCSSQNDEVVALSRSSLDITDRSAIFSKISEQKPDVIINCAAFTDVDGAESKPDRCYAVNEDGVGNLAEAAKNSGCGFITISTDFVFDGEKEGFYTEEDTPNPKSVYGHSKLAGELTALSIYPKSIVVRTGWIFGGGGTNFLSVLPSFLASGKEISAISDSFGTPTYSHDLAFRLRELALLNRPAIYHVTNSGEGTSYYGFAMAAAEIGGFDSGLVKETASAELNRPAARPRNSRLSSVMLKKCGMSELPEWKDSLRESVRA